MHAGSRLGSILPSHTIPAPAVMTKREKKSKGLYLTSTQHLMTGSTAGAVTQLELLQDAAAHSGLSTATLKKILEGLRATVIKRLRDRGICRISGIARLRVKTLPVRKATTGVRFGKSVQIKARPRPVKTASAIAMPPVSKVLE